MRKTKKMLALFIVLAMIISNCFALLSNIVFAEGEKTIFFNTGDYDIATKKVTFHVGQGDEAVEVPVQISGTTANLEQHNGGCKLVYTESLGDVVKLQVLSGYIPDSMRIRTTGDNNFYQELGLGENNYVILSDPGNGWILPNEFYFEIVHVGDEVQQGQGFAIHMDTSTFTDTTATFVVGEANVIVTVSNTSSTIQADGDNCSIRFTESLGDTVKFQVSGFNSETMEIYADGGDGFYHGLPVDQNGYIEFSGIDADEYGEHSWGVPTDFHFGIIERGSNHGPGFNGTTVQFDTNTFTSNTATFLTESENPVTVTITGTESTIVAEDEHGKLEFTEGLGNPVRFQVDGNFNPDTMEIYASDGGPEGFTYNLEVDQSGYIIFTEDVISKGGFHFGITVSGGSPMNIDQMKEIRLDNQNGNDSDDFTVYFNRHVTNYEGITFDVDTNTLTIENLNAPDKVLMLHCIGEGFNINVVGNNKIKKIQAFTQFDHFAQEIYIKGNGTLTINENKTEDNAINMCTYFGRSILRVGADVTLNLNAKEDVVRIEIVSDEDLAGQQAIIFEGNQNVQVSKEPCIFHGIKFIKGYYKYSDNQEFIGILMTRSSDSNGTYVGRRIFDYDEHNQQIPESERYEIMKAMKNSTTHGCYVLDETFEREHGNMLELSAAEFEASDFSIVTEKNELNEDIPISVYNPIGLNYSTVIEVYKDSNNTEYGAIRDYNSQTGQDEVQLYDISAIEGTASYWLEENNNVDFDTLEAVNEDTLQEGTYNYLIHETELEIKPGGEHVHDLEYVPGAEETCTKAGNKPYFKCKGCNDWFIDSEGINLISDHSEVVIPARGHKATEVVSESITKATLTKDGRINRSIVLKCSVCGEELGGRGDQEIIPYPKTISLAKTAFVYNKKVQKPTVKVVGSNGKVIPASNYTVTYSNKNSKAVGEYKVTIKFKGNFEGTKTLTYQIKPTGTTLGKLTPAKKQFTATWKAQKTETTGYEIQYSLKSNFKSGNKTVNVKSKKTTSSVVKKLKAKKKYFVRIRTYKTVKVNGKNVKIYSNWSKSKNVTTKK